MMVRRLRGQALGAVVAAMVLLVVSCSSEPSALGPVVVEVPRLVTPASTVGFDPATGVIRVGIIADLSGPGASIARSQVAGAEAYWSTVNAGGGIDGRFPVELVIRDTAGSAAAAVSIYRDLRDSVVMFSQLVGTKTTDVLRELLSTDGILAVPTTRLSEWTQRANLLPVGASYAVEALSGISYIVDTDEEPRVWCVVADPSLESADSMLGAIIASRVLDAVQSFDTAANDAGADFVLNVAGIGDETRVVEEATALGCERVWLALGPATSSGVIAAAAAAGAEFFAGVGSEVALPLPAGVSEWARDHLVVVVDAPSWGDAGLGARALRDAVATHVPDLRPDGWLRSGFTSQYVVDILLTTAARDGDLSRQTVFDLGTNLGPVDTGGLSGSPDWREDPPTVPGSVTIHAVDQVGVDPMGLRVIGTFSSPNLEALTSPS